MAAGIKTAIALTLLLCGINASINYVSNGSFELPAIAGSGYFINTATGWTGMNFDLENLHWSSGYGQYIDLQGNPYQNGYIEQNITLPDSGNCSLSFLRKARTTNYNSYIMEVYWNGQLLSTQVANTTARTFVQFNVSGVLGSNNLKFQ